MVEDFIMEFSSHGRLPIKEDQSKYRFLYEMAISYYGDHRPNDSSSKAVRLRTEDPDCFTSLIELPCKCKVPHVDFLLDGEIKNNLASKIYAINECKHTIFGGKHGRKKRYGPPFVLVIGPTWQDVDKAVNVLKDEIRRHCEKCGCSYDSKRASR